MEHEEALADLLSEETDAKLIRSICLAQIAIYEHLGKRYKLIIKLINYILILGDRKTQIIECANRLCSVD